MELTIEQKERLLKVWELCKTGTAKTHKAKAELIQLHNELYNTNYKPTTNCSSCMKTCYNGIKTVVNEIQM